LNNKGGLCIKALREKRAVTQGPINIGGESPHNPFPTSILARWWEMERRKVMIRFHKDDKGCMVANLKGYHVSWYRPGKGEYKVVRCPSGRYAGSSGFFSAPLHVILEGIVSGKFDILAR